MTAKCCCAAMSERQGDTSRTARRRSGERGFLATPSLDLQSRRAPATATLYGWLCAWNSTTVPDGLLRLGRRGVKLRREHLQFE